MTDTDPTRTHQRVAFELERADKALERAKAEEERAVAAVHQLEGGLRGLFARVTGGHGEQLDQAVERAEAAILARKDVVQRWKRLTEEVKSLNVAEAGARPMPSSHVPLALSQAKRTLKRAEDTREALANGDRADWGALRLAVADLRAVSPQAGAPKLPAPDVPDVAERLADWIAEVEVVVGMLESDEEEEAAARVVTTTDARQEELARTAIRETQTLLAALQVGRFRDTSRTVKLRMGRYGRAADRQETADKAQKSQELARLQADAELAASNVFATLETPPERISMQTVSWTHSINDVALNDARYAAEKTLRLLTGMFPNLDGG